MKGRRARGSAEWRLIASESWDSRRLTPGGAGDAVTARPESQKHSTSLASVSSEPAQTTDLHINPATLCCWWHVGFLALSSESMLKHEKP